MDNSTILWSNLSLCDKENRVFELNTIFYRGIFKKDSSIISFLESDLYSELYELGYIPKTTISSLQNENFEVILEHETATFIAYPHEWSYEMLKDACLLYLNIVSLANKHGYIIKDGQPYNIVFFNGMPKFVDIGSFVKSEKRINLEEFNRTMLLPLLIWAKGYYSVALNIIGDDRAKLSLKDGIKLYFGISFYGKPTLNLLKKMYSFYSYEKKEISNSNLKSKIDFVKSIKPKQTISAWGNYHTEYDDPNQLKSTSRFDKIMEYINQYDDIKSVYDVACNQGVVSKLISKNCPEVEKIIATDYDENAIDYFYKTLANYNSITIGISDLICPISNFQEKPIQDRFKVDCVLALALTHHLILGQKFHIDVIINRLKNLTTKYLFVEFMPLGLWSGKSEDRPQIPDFYTIDWFTENINQYFTILKIEELETNRVLFICEIKK